MEPQLDSKHCPLPLGAEYSIELHTAAAYQGGSTWRISMNGYTFILQNCAVHLSPCKFDGQEPHKVQSTYFSVYITNRNRARPPPSLAENVLFKHKIPDRADTHGRDTMTSQT
jgi:hypothetical protein